MLVAAPPPDTACALRWWAARVLPAVNPATNARAARHIGREAGPSCSRRGERLLAPVTPRQPSSTVSLGRWDAPLFTPSSRGGSGDPGADFAHRRRPGRPHHEDDVRRPPNMEVCCFCLRPGALRLPAAPAPIIRARTPAVKPIACSAGVRGSAGPASLEGRAHRPPAWRHPMPPRCAPSQKKTPWSGRRRGRCRGCPSGG